MILVTGSNGLIGRAFKSRLTGKGVPVRDFDIARSPLEDTRNPEALDAAIDGVEGIVHLAAVSRVVWAERDPQLTQAVNVDALQSLLTLVHARKQRPWVVFASSREVYGEPAALPVAEDTALAPLNVYARSKVRGEQLITEAREAGVVANIVRFSNVYGRTSDHSDRVVPAFARAAALGGKLRLDGPENMFDFTHVDDVVNGLSLHVEATGAGEAFPPVHFVTGRGTTLQGLASIAAREARSSLEIEIAPPRNYDVAQFFGDPARARQLLGWQSRIDMESGFAALAADYRDNVDDAGHERIDAAPAVMS